MKRKKLACLLLAGMMIASAVPAQAFAATQNSSASSTQIETPVTKDGTQECQVEAAIASSFSVVVPKKITLQGDTKTGSYQVTCTGDIAGNEGVSVTPDATFKMKQSGKNDVTATVTQAKTIFRGKDHEGDLGETEEKMGTADAAGTPIDGSIAAQDLSAGAWSGTFNFAIALNTVTQ